MATERLRPFTPAWCQVGPDNPNLHPPFTNNYVGYPSYKVSNFVQTTEDDGAPYTAYCWRNAPKASQATTAFISEIYNASFYLTFSDDIPGPGDDIYCDKIVTVVEASNGHQYWLDQTVTANFMQGEEEFEVSHTFTSADWATTPEYDPETGLGYLANPSGPSSFTKRSFSLIINWLSTKSTSNILSLTSRPFRLFTKIT